MGNVSGVITRTSVSGSYESWRPTMPTPKLTTGTLTPAYGREPKDKQEIRQDFLDGKDFILHLYNHPETYCSLRDFEPGASITLRYSNYHLAVVVQVPGGE